MISKLKSGICLPSKGSCRTFLALAIAAPLAMASTSSVSAQDGPGVPVSEDDGLNVPQQVVMLGHNDPNLRTATAKVNGQVITGTDVDQRLALILAANNQPISDEEKARLRLQVLRNLIDETLQIQEAKAQEIEVSQADVEQAYARVATQNFGQDTAAMDAYLRRIGSSPASLKRQIEGEVSWQRLLGRNVQPFINVSEEEVNELLARLQDARGTKEFHLAEIYLSATPENQQAVFENARRIVEQLRAGGSFVAYARQFSEASTAAVGGDLGWVRPAQLPAELATTAREMQRGQLVGPVAVPGGFSILYMIDERQVLMADPRDAVMSLKQISIDLPKGISEADARKRVASFAAAVQNIKGCGDAETAAPSFGATVVTNDQIRVRTLPAALQDALLQLSVGQSTPPFGSADDGVRVLMLCGRDDPQSSDGPSFDQLMSQLEDDRVGKRAQRYLRDLRRDAIIEYN
ncbi:MAG: peptidylprolyl isomerase [Caenibius sp.]